MGPLEYCGWTKAKANDLQPVHYHWHLTAYFVHLSIHYRLAIFTKVDKNTYITNAIIKLLTKNSLWFKIYAYCTKMGQENVLKNAFVIVKCKQIYFMLKLHKFRIVCYYINKFILWWKQLIHACFKSCFLDTSHHNVTVCISVLESEMHKWSATDCSHII